MIEYASSIEECLANFVQVDMLQAVSWAYIYFLN